MAATREDIARWFDAGISQGATHMIVVCDTYDWGDYPVYVTPPEDARRKADEYRKKSMQQVMEVYDLNMDKAMQMAEHRAFHY